MTTIQPYPVRDESFVDRHAGKILPGVAAILGIFGIGDMISGAADLEKGEKVYMQGVTGMSWNNLKATKPRVARMIDTLFRTNGVTLMTLSLLSLAIYLAGFRKGERWAWVTLWALPVWMALTALVIARVEKVPGSGTPVPVISGSVLALISSISLLLSIPRFFREANPGRERYD